MGEFLLLRGVHVRGKMCEAKWRGVMGFCEVYVCVYVCVCKRKHYFTIVHDEKGLGLFLENCKKRAATRD